MDLQPEFEYCAVCLTRPSRTTDCICEECYTSLQDAPEGWSGAIMWAANRARYFSQRNRRATPSVNLQQIIAQVRSMKRYIDGCGEDPDGWYLDRESVLELLEKNLTATPAPQTSDGEMLDWLESQLTDSNEISIIREEFGVVLEIGHEGDEVKGVGQTIAEAIKDLQENL